jgi:alpha-L-fucosidase
MALSILIATMLSSASAADLAWYDDSDAERLQRLATYLKVSREALYGTKAVNGSTITSDLKAIVTEIDKQYAAIFGKEQAEKKMSPSERSVKSLEERTLEILKALWGDQWTRVVQP